ncbi:MAG TPA: NTP transferase domain-containing protein [Methanolinea sp.]|nr:NTP transferase domain-containing protein [Methanolinea sp.]HQK56792.1 NTP transferase domain-containing protein [Methanolinea sp.]
MYALILAGGLGSRLGLGEKPLVTIRGVPMIRYVIEAFNSGGFEIVVVLSRKTPYTHNWCRAHAIPHYTAGGRGYVEDIAEAVEALGIEGPLFTSVADIPCLEDDIIATLHASYLESGKDALSCWIPKDLAEKYGSRVAYSEIIDGVEACPAGINIICGNLIDSLQEETRVLLADPRLAYNINTREALEFVTKIMHTRLDHGQRPWRS